MATGFETSPYIFTVENPKYSFIHLYNHELWIENSNIQIHTMFKFSWSVDWAV